MSSFNTIEKPVSVEWNGDTFIMTMRNEIGNLYSYAYSSDGITWTNASLPTNMGTKNPYFSKWLGDKYILGGNLVTGSSSILTNVKNGVVRNSISAPTGYQVYDIESNLEHLHTVTFPRSVVLAMGGQSGDTNTAYYSNNQGNSWTACSSAFSTAFKGAAWNGKRWVGVGSGGNTIATSYDGASWTGRGSVTFTTAGNAVEWNDVKNMFVAVGSGGNTIASSKDGIYWTGRTSTIFSIGNDVKCNGDIWVAAGVPLSGNQSLAYSYDGMYWFSPPQGNLFSTSAVKVAWFESQWIAVGIDPSYNIALSADGINWKMIYDASFSGNMKHVFADEYDIYITATNNYALLPEGSLERKIIKTDVSANAIINVKTNTLVGGNGSISLTAHFDTYANTAVSGITAINSFAWNTPNRGYADIHPISVACGSGTGTLAYSRDGLKWINIANTIFTTQANKAVWNGKIWVAVGAGNNWVASSYDGIVWTPRDGAIMTECYDVAWNGYAFIAVGTGSTVMAKSTDGINWTSVTSAASVFSSSASAIEWTGTVWLAYGSGGNTTAISSDIYGDSWQATSSPNLAITSATAATVSVSSSSSSQPTFTAANAFDGSFNTNMTEWYSGTSTYTATSGIYAGAISTTYGGTNTVSGEWLQAQMSSSGVAKYYYVTINNSSTTAIPKQWTLLGSTDGTTWSLIDTFINTAATYPNNTWKYGWTSFPINIYRNTTSYSYYRIVFQSSYGQTYVAIADISIFYESGSSKSLNTKLRPILMKNSILHPTQILSVDGTFLNIYQLTDLNCNLIKNLYINSNYVKNIVYGINDGLVTATAFDGYRHFVGADNGKLSLVLNTNSYTNYNFDSSFNNTSLTSGLTSIYGACFNKKFVLLGGTGGNVITYNHLVSGTGSSTWQNTNANSIFTQVNGIASNSGYGHVVVPSSIYLNQTEKLSLVAPKSYNYTIVPETTISVQQYPL